MLQVIEAAKANGSWNALDDSEAGIVPPDLATAFAPYLSAAFAPDLAAHPPAATEWESFSPSIRKGILQWIASAKRPETRAKHVDETATMAAGDEKANEWEHKS